MNRLLTLQVVAEPLIDRFWQEKRSNRCFGLRCRSHELAANTLDCAGDMQLAPFEVDILASQAKYLAAAQAER